MTERILAADTADGATDRPPPARFAYDRHTWKEIAHLLANLPVSLVGFTYVVTVLFTGAFLTLTVIGFPLLAAGLMGARQLGKLERGRARGCSGCGSTSRARCRCAGRAGSSRSCGCR